MHHPHNKLIKILLRYKNIDSTVARVTSVDFALNVPNWGQNTTTKKACYMLLHTNET